MSVVEVQHAFRTPLPPHDALDRVESLLEADGRWAVMSRRSDHVVATRCARPSKWTRPFSQVPDASVTLWVADDESETGAVVRVAAVLDTSPRKHDRELDRLASYFEGFGLRFNG
ncbi:hypothetical protein G3T36_05280 [Diaminobutyricibacter tongyongensis]|uniref:Uncharacterized protein n=1 Tax=Leifsonia tongyongensis TaxID=1268043 RepID=A0A6L9XW85_9MICO|nr:hypothetical protein [Diaminobutyricibacter tongyongensis]NEN05278.1 hypothetical protein [Diaminobutyricibacter tongyongensis]